MLGLDATEACLDQLLRGASDQFNPRTVSVMRSQLRRALLDPESVPEIVLDAICMRVDAN